MKASCAMVPNNLPFVSIIIPAYNEAKYIGYCMESIRNLNYSSEKYEIIVVDNGSTDETVSIANKFTTNVHVCPGLSISALRNYGAKKARGEIYAFIDADCVADKDWLKNAVDFLMKEPCIIGSIYEIPPNATWIERVWFSQTDLGRQEVSFLCGGNMLVLSDIFNKIGGFNEALTTGEDYEFCTKAKRLTKVISDDRVRVIHLGNPKTLRQFLKREIWYGLGAFGSLRINWFDKSLIATVLFSSLLLLNIVGIAKLLVSLKWNLLVLGNIGILLLLILTIFYRKKYVKGILHAFQLSLLYLLFYAGRSFSLIYILTGKKFNYKKQQFVGNSLTSK